MDRKAIIVVGSSIAFIILWVFVIVPRYFTQPALPPIPVAVTGNSSAPAGPASSSPAPVMTSAQAARIPLVTTSAPEETITLTNANVRYVFTSHGGGLKHVELVHYPQSMANGRKQESGRLASLNTKAPLPVLALVGGAALQGDGMFSLTRTANGVRAEKVFSNGVTLVKEFRPGSNYLCTATARLENHSDQSVTLAAQQWVVGTATPMRPVPDSSDIVGVMWYPATGKPVDTTVAWFDNKSMMGCGPSNPRFEYRGGTSNVAWVASHNQFFTLVAIPSTNAPEVVLHRVELPKPTREELPPNVDTAVAPSGIQAALEYPGVTLAAGDAIERKFTLYTGPKEYRTLAEIGILANTPLDEVMQFGFFGIVSKSLLVGMNWFHDTLNFGYGLAIIAITFIIKLVFWPLTAASTRSMKRMAALQPQMKAIQEKYKDDPAKMNRKVMEFMKENRVSPLGGCLPMLIQIPVFFGFFTMIRSAIELRGAHFLWVADLSQADTLFYLGGFPINLLPLLMGATMLWQAQLTPPSPGMDPSQQKIMKYMPLMFMVFLYNYSAALTLYWTTQNLLTILQTKMTKMKDTSPALAAAVPVRKKHK